MAGMSVCQSLPFRMSTAFLSTFDILKGITEQRLAGWMGPSTLCRPPMSDVSTRAFAVLCAPPADACRNFERNLIGFISCGNPHTAFLCQFSIRCLTEGAQPSPGLHRLFNASSVAIRGGSGGGVPRMLRESTCRAAIGEESPAGHRQHASLAEGSAMRLFASSGTRRN
jgi:hypothetical protein